MKDQQLSEKAKDCKQLEDLFIQMCKIENLTTKYYEHNKIASKPSDFANINHICNDKPLFKVLCLMHHS